MLQMLGGLLILAGIYMARPRQTAQDAVTQTAAIEHQAFDTVAQVRALCAGKIPPHAVNADAATRLERLLRAPR